MSLMSTHSGGGAINSHRQTLPSFLPTYAFTYLKVADMGAK
jgi:hypothetical protein